MTRLTEPKKTAFRWIEDNAERLSEFHRLVWNYAESAFREYKSARAFAEFHREEGFDVEVGVAGMPTAYVATWGEGKPVISTYTEYDAVPGRWQDPVPHRSAENPYSEELTPPREWERMWRSVIPSHQKKFDSDDYVEFMWHCPAVWIQVYRPRLSVPGERLPGWTHVALGGMKGPIDRTICTAGKAIGGTMLDLLTEPGKLKECKDEWSERVSKEYKPPQLDPEWDPPIDLPWPEYVTTERGYDWHIPTPKK